MTSLGFQIDPARRAGSLAVAHQQVVEIAKALSRKVKIIVFDEPTAVLSAQDAGRLHGIIGRLRSEGVGVVYISHRLEEVLTLADRVTVMKDGQVVATRAAADLTIDEMIRMMVGRPMAALFPEKRPRKDRRRAACRSQSSARAGSCATSASPCARARSWGSAG